MGSSNSAIIKKYFNCVLKIYRRKESWHPYPWLFRIIDPQGIEHFYGGTPNQCESAHSALMRGWYRCKWINDGSINDRYVRTYR